ncbi:MAG: CoA-binding protein [bacterium]|nr:CoA-binding protein [bacterium]
MSILIDKKTKVLVQGITGKEGSRAAEQMLAYGTEVVAGVTPGKGGQEVFGKAVYNSVKEALVKHPEINTTSIAVPGVFAKAAMLEAIENKIPLIHVLTEHVPILDSAIAFARAKKAGVRIVGPSSIGIISPGEAKLGSIGGSDPNFSYQSGEIGVISKSGGMTSEISFILKKTGLGVSTAVGIGGDMIIGSTFADLAGIFKDDPKTKALVIYGEQGGTYEEDLAEYLLKSKFEKPVVAFIAGIFAESLPAGQALGHAGALIESGKGRRIDKVKALEKAGVGVAAVPDELPKVLQERLK